MIRRELPDEFVRWLDLTDASLENSRESILLEQQRYDAWALRADLDGVCILCAVQPRVAGSQYCRRHRVKAESF